ncbi:MAG: trehalose-phosphatase [Corynebacterium sp.]|nr:trehalose-phosphatase [Corynebacterium sp.]
MTQPQLLIASDFDGTLAPFADDPADVVPDARALAALTRLAGYPGVTVAILSGRALTSLRAVLPPTVPFLLIGSHGAESSAEPVDLSAAQEAALAAVDTALAPLCTEGAWVEEKPVHRVFHVRPVRDAQLREEKLAAANDIAHQLAPAHPVLKAMSGKNVVEFAVSAISKGAWIEENREDAQVIFAGDDTTDETVFAVLRPGDVGIKVGSGHTAARVRVGDVAGLADYLEQLADQYGSSLP